MTHQPWRPLEETQSHHPLTAEGERELKTCHLWPTVGRLAIVWGGWGNNVSVELKNGRCPISMSHGQPLRGLRESGASQGTVVLETKLFYLRKLSLFNQNGRALWNDVTMANISVLWGMIYELSMCHRERSSCLSEMAHGLHRARAHVESWGLGDFLNTEALQGLRKWLGWYSASLNSIPWSHRNVRHSGAVWHFGIGESEPGGSLGLAGQPA